MCVFAKIGLDVYLLGILLNKRDFSSSDLGFKILSFEPFLRELNMKICNNRSR